MKLKVFSILDTKADVFHAPFYFGAVGLAVRAFKDLANDSNSTVSRHPDDFRLFEIGVFDDQSGRFENLPEFNALGWAKDYIEVDKRQEVMPFIKKERKNEAK